MITTTSAVTDDSPFSFLYGRMQLFILRYPEWWVWAFSLLVWAFLILNLFDASNDLRYTGPIIYCTPTGAVEVFGHSAYEIQSTLTTEGIFSKILTTLSDNLLHWTIMVIAMMFPLLNEPIRHVAFSIRQKDRFFGILWFLVGYTITWTLAGVLFLLLPLFLDVAIADRTPLLNGLIKASGFLLAAVLIWQPSRPIRMTKCSQTMPIRIEGWQLPSDCLFYGLNMGFNCLNMCWAPMAALMLAHHNINLMFVVTFVVIYERYLLPHTNKLPGYAWGLVGITLFGIEMLA